MPEEGVISNVDAPNLYEIPLSLHDEGLDDYVCQLLRLEHRARTATTRRGRSDEGGGLVDLSHWQDLVRRVESASKPVRIGLIGKYVNLPDAYLSVVEALRHGGYAHGAKLQLDWVQAEEVEGLMAEGRLRDLDGMIVPGGFRRPWYRRHDRRRRLRPRAPDPVPRPLPRACRSWSSSSPATWPAWNGPTPASSSPARRTSSST